MITLTREEAQQVLDALNEYVPESDYADRPIGNVIDDLRAKLSAPESVPIPTNADQAELMTKLGYNWLFHHAPYRLVKPLYTAPPQREWQGLTHEEIAEESGAAKAQNHMVLTLAEGFFCGARWAEAKLREKNT